MEHEAGGQRETSVGDRPGGFPQIYVAEESRSLSREEQLVQNQLKIKCLGLGLVSLSRTVSRLRSTVLFLGEGDGNTKFFHVQA